MKIIITIITLFILFLSHSQETANMSVFNIPLCQTDTTTFYNMSSSNSCAITGSFWDFGDGGTSTLLYPTHLYAAPGTYTVQLISTWSCAPNDTITQNVTIEYGNPIPPTNVFISQDTFCFSNNSVDVNLFVLQNSFNELDSVVVYWGDGSSDVVLNPTIVLSFSHTYTSSGQYSVQLLNISSCGIDTTFETIHIFSPPVADFSYTGNTCVGSTINFNDLSTAGTLAINSWSWDFGNTTSSTNQNPNMSYSTGNEYIAFLTVEDVAGCSSTTSDTISVNSDPGIVDFTTSSGCPCNSISFNAAGTATSLQWDLDDSNTETNTAFTHDYILPGDYSVNVVGTDASGCTYSITKNIEVCANEQTHFPSKSNNNWEFYEKSSADFSSGSPVISHNNQLLGANYPGREGAATISHPTTGALLFYTNGEAIWDASHAVMQNGQDIRGNNSSNQGVLIIPFPGNQDKYYVFTNSGTTIGGPPGRKDTIMYHIVDMTLNGGLGAVISGQKNIFIVKTEGSEAMSGTIKKKKTPCENAEYWLTITSDQYEFKTYLIDDSGISLANTNTFTASSSVNIGGSTGSNFSHNGTIFTKGAVDGLLIYKFDLQTGNLSNQQFISSPYFNYSDPSSSGAHQWSYNQEFSEDNSKIYTAYVMSTFWTSTFFLTQYDVFSNNIKSTEFQYNLGSNTGRTPYMADDGKIYFSKQFTWDLGVINFPNNTGAAASVGAGPTLSPQFSGNGLQNIVKLHLPIIDTTLADFSADTSNCLSVAFTNSSETINYADACSYLASVDTSLLYEWDFGDGNTSTDFEPTHVYGGFGSYNVQLIVSRPYMCTADTIIKTITIINTPEFTIVDTIICASDSIYLENNWQTISGQYNDTLAGSLGCDSIITTNLTVLPVVTFSQSPTICFGTTFIVGSSIYNTTGTYTDVLVSSSGCDSTVTTNLTVLPANAFAQSPTICFGDSFIVGSSTYAATGTYTDVLVDANGCDSTVTTNLTVLPENTFSQSPTICNGDSFIVGTSTYTTTGNYTDVLTDINGCDSTVTTNLMVLPANTFSQSPTICFGQSFTVGTSTYSTTGNYTDVLIDGNGCDSTVTTNLTVLPANIFSQSPSICAGQSFTVGTSTYSATGIYTDVLTNGNGCDSTVTTNLTVLPANAFSQSPSICAGQSFTVGTSIYSTTGNYTDVLVDANGCDSTVTTNLTILPANTFSQSPTICFGSSFTVGGSTYTATGTYTDVLTDVNGCDSTVTTHLTVLPENTFSQSPSICAGQTFTVGTNTYSTTGNYTDILVDANGCDSTVTTNLIVLPTITHSQSPTICFGTSFTVGTNTYNATGTYTDVLTDGNGCDSTVTTNLTVLPTNTFSQSPTICNGASFTVGTNTYNATGTYTDVLVDVNGCDSTVTTNLTVLPQNTFSQSPTICNGDSFIVGTSTYTTTGNYTDVLTDINGCDSTVTTNLTVLPANTFSQSPTICFGNSFTVGTSVYSTSGVYTDVFTSGNGCDSTVTTNLTVLPANTFSQSPSICDGQSFTVGSSVYAATGTYTDVLVDFNGCDSTVTTNLTVNPIDDASFSYTSTNFCLSGNNPSATITGSLGGAFTIDNAGVINPTTGEVDLTLSGIGTFTITYSTNGACPSLSNASITIDPLDNASFTYPSATYCNNDPNPSPTISGVLGGTFTIDNGGVIDPNTGAVSLGGSGLGSFVITYTTSGLCSGTETFALSISNCSPPLANFSVNDSLLCEGQCIEITNLSVDATSVQWTMTGGTPSTSTDLNPTVCYLNAGTYIVEMVVSNGYGTDIITRTIYVNSSPTVDAGLDVTIPLGATTPLFVTGGTSWIWSPSQYLDCSTCEDPIAAPSATTSFVVIGADDNGCTASDTVIVIIEGEISVFIPNVFSPNGDGENDLFKVFGSSFPERYNMRIYNRWGALVFESEDQNTSWNGTNKKGEEVPQAVFVYQFIGSTVSGQIIEKAGNVMLAR